MSEAVTQETARDLLRDLGIPEDLPPTLLNERLFDVTGRRTELIITPNLEGKEIHGVWGPDLEQQVNMVFLPPAREQVQFFICFHEFGHMLATPHGRPDGVGANPEVVKMLGPAIPLGRRLAFTNEHSDFSRDEERLAEMVGGELAVRVLRHERARGKDFQFGRVFGG